MSEIKKTPKWVQRYARRVVEALGLQAWDLAIQCKCLETKEDRKCVGNSQSRRKYLDATIELDYQHVKKPSARGKVTIVHELLHVALAHQRQVVFNLCDDLLKKRVGNFAWHAHEEAHEETVTRLSHALYRLIERAYPEKSVKTTKRKKSDA